MGIPFGSLQMGDISMFAHPGQKAGYAPAWHCMTDINRRKQTSCNYDFFSSFPIALFSFVLGQFDNLLKTIYVSSILNCTVESGWHRWFVTLLACHIVYFALRQKAMQNWNRGYTVIVHVGTFYWNFDKKVIIFLFSKAYIHT